MRVLDAARRVEGGATQHGGRGGSGMSLHVSACMRACMCPRPRRPKFVCMNVYVRSACSAPAYMLSTSLRVAGGSGELSSDF